MNKIDYSVLYDMIIFVLLMVFFAFCFVLLFGEEKVTSKRYREQDLQMILDECERPSPYIECELVAVEKQ